MSDKLSSSDEIVLSSAWCDFEVDGEVDPALPGIYVWTVDEEDVYVGKYTETDRPKNAYRRNVENLLNGKPYRKSKPAGFREIHHCLADAVRDGRKIKVTLVENVSPERLDQRERELIGLLRSQGWVLKKRTDSGGHNRRGPKAEPPASRPTVQQPAKMWSGRFREPLDRTFEQWQRSFPFDWRLLTQEVAASKAHAQAIAAAGILTQGELTQTLDGLTRVGERAINWSNRISATSGQVDYETSDQQIGAAIVASAPQAEDIHHYVEIELTKEIGPIALKLHTGRSRNEQIATDMRLFVRESIDSTLAALGSWLEALLALAEANMIPTANVMPGFTHLQRAEPVLIAHWLLAYVSMLERDLSRFTDARTRMNFCPLGSGAIAGATLALDRTIASNALVFTAPTANSMDATSDRDFMLDFAQAASTLGLHISRFAEEITLYATAEFGFVDLPEAFSTGSSAMPQKKNPDLTELARGKSARLLGAATALATLVKGLPLAYNKDLQEGQEQVFDIADTLTGLLSVLPNFTRALKFRTANMNAAAQSGYLNAMAGATYLSNKGVPFRKAHEIIGNAVRMGLEQGKELSAMSLADLRTLSEDFDEGFFAAISLEATLDCHNTAGGTATNQVREALSAARTRLSSFAESGGSASAPAHPEGSAHG